MEITDKQFSDLITRLMIERGISQNELAKRLGKSSGRMSEKLGSKPAWKFGELFSVADALGVDPVFIVEELKSQVE